MLIVSLWNMLRVGMSIWIKLLVLLIHFLKHADSVIYVSEDSEALDEAASSCNLATPEINFKTSGNTVSLDDENLNISEGESVWSGYVQTYAAFLYEGCCGEQFANSSANYTNMHMDPGECYSICKTDVIGMKTTTCYCNPRPIEKQTHATGCYSPCSNPDGIVCGGSGSVSIYRKVLYAGYGDMADNCRALVWNYNGQRFYAWRYCLHRYAFLCDKDVTSSTQFEYYWHAGTWRTTSERCIQHDKKPAAELTSGLPDLTFPYFAIFWIGQIRSRVICKYAESSNQTHGWRHGVITKYGGEYVLTFHTNLTTLKSLCENELTSAPSAGMSSPASVLTSVTVPESATQSSHMLSPITTTTTPEESRNNSDHKAQPIAEQHFPMIAVYVAVPVVLVLVAVVVIVMLYKRRKLTESKKDDQSLSQNNDHSSPVPKNAYEANQEDKDRHDYFILEPVNEYAVVKDADINAAIDNEYDTTTNLPKKANITSNDTDNVYNKLESLADDTSNHTNTATAIVDDTYDKATYDEQDSTYNTADTLSVSRVANHKVTDSEYSTLNQK